MFITIKLYTFCCYSCLKEEIKPAVKGEIKSAVKEELK
jgi:hypothetical protein